MRMRWIIGMLGMALLFSKDVYAQLPDPTRPANLQTDDRQENTYELSAILMSTDRKIALLNGKWAHEGEVVDGAKVISIEKNIVKIESPLGTQTLQLLTDAIQRRDDKDLGHEHSAP
jgi:hypothetical protein